MLEREPSHLPIIRSPCVDTDESKHDPDEDNNKDDEDDEDEDKDDDDTNSSKQEDDLENGQVDQTAAKSRRRTQAGPKFRRFRQATNIELFYDLFFVANLTAFTSVHEVNDAATLKQYIGFFCIIWFTWYQVGLYDVRFFMDSLLERTLKAIQFLVLMGFAFVGPKFNVGEDITPLEEERGQNWEYLKGLTILLMISRLVLVVQYLQVLCFARSFKGVFTPLALIASSYFAAAMIYLGLFWTFDPKLGEDNSYIAWYVVGVAESVLVTVVSCIWRSISFVHTHLVERMSLLTLIILGEGVIGVARACNSIASSDGEFRLTGSAAAALFCAVMNLYFLYMIYFDGVREDKFGRIRQQLWFVQKELSSITNKGGTLTRSQCITWTAAVQRQFDLVHQATGWARDLHGPSNNTAGFEWTADQINQTALALFTKQLSSADDYIASLQAFAFLYQTENAVVPSIRNGSHDRTAAVNAYDYIKGGLSAAIFNIAGFTPAESETGEYVRRLMQDASTPKNFSSASSDDPYQQESITGVESYYYLFDLVFVYFFITTGLFVMINVVLAILNRGVRRKTKVYWLRLTIAFLIGLGLSLLTIMNVTPSAEGFILSAWLLPTVTICLFTIVALHNVKLIFPNIKKKSDNPQNSIMAHRPAMASRRFIRRTRRVDIFEEDSEVGGGGVPRVRWSVEA